MEVIKRLRQQQIRDLVSSQTIGTQHELAASLRERGYRVTQATISRDVTEMGLIKHSANGSRGYALPPVVEQPETTGEERLALVLRNLPVQIRHAGNLLVVRAVPGSAHPIAAALDRTGWPEVIGSIAGDDTVFVACADRASADRISRRLNQLSRLQT
ncbi:MAG TPA: arginine repressor [Candidatus Limnocylindrales bacterium]|nr:arginine repressor [Candidatus Limnocylindrales bacterium]